MDSDKLSVAMESEGGPTVSSENLFDIILHLKFTTPLEVVSSQTKCPFYG